MVNVRPADYHSDMSTDFKQLICDLQQRRVTLAQIADYCGFCSKGHVHDLKQGRQKTVSFEVGAKLVQLHQLKTLEASLSKPRAAKGKP